ncbi:MAG: hypothetical protein RIT28_2957 [Pseudomonadota bacterium]
MRTPLLSLCALALTLNACKGDAPAGDSAADDTEITGGDSSGGDSSGGDSSGGDSSGGDSSGGDSAAPTDADEDGFTAEVDCDDDDAAVNPDADELCDEVDNNCDGLIDVGAIDAQLFYGDADEDGYAGDAVTVTACEAPEGFSDTITDCDDLNASAFPGGIEVCDGADNDCDGLLDSADDDVEEGSSATWLPDEDGDGYGDDAGTPVDSCDQPEGYAIVGGDCDTADAAISPGAEELCDGFDNNCDGLTDGDDPDLSGGVFTWYEDLDSDGFGDDATVTESCAQPDGYVSVGGDCDVSDADVSPGATEACDGLDNDCDGLADVDDPDLSSSVFTWYDDADGDGFGDDASATETCAQPAGWVSVGGDCDESDADISPGATEACDELDNDCDGLIDDDDSSVSVGLTRWYGDSDSDGYGGTRFTLTACEQPSGYVTDATDCNDLRDDVNPAADELCDSVDNDCDSLIDDDDSLASGEGSAWLPDGDGDGFGDSAGAPVTACVEPAGYVADGGDCDSADATIFPGAGETCDELDNDCDGLIDDDDSGVSGTSTWYADADADTYGSSRYSTKACDAPSGYVADKTDCDDLRATVNPAATEVCDGGTDNDCDGLTEDNDPSIDTSDGIAVYLDGDGDGFGLDGTGLMRCALPSGYSTLDGDCDDSLAAVSPDGVEVCNTGIDEDCSGDSTGCGISGTLGVSNANFTLSDGSSSYLGYDMGAGDINGDGYDDLVVSSYTITVGSATSAGRSYVLYGPLTADRTVTSSYDASLDGVVAYDYAGKAVATGGDLNGDGYDDIVIGGSGYDPSSRSSGGLVGLRYGSATKLSGSTSFAALDASFAGATSSDYLGDVVKFIGDVNGDGYDELAVGAWGTDSPASSAGAVYIIPGSATRYSGMSTVTTAAKLTITGVLSSDYMGDLHSIAGPIDLDGDGYNDLVAGSKYIDSGTTYSIGGAYIFYGTAGTLSTSVSFSVAFANASFLGGVAYDYLAEFPESAGDVNGDGYDDLVLGATGSDTGASDAGCAYLIHGGATRLSGAKTISSAAAATMCGKTASDGVGSSVGGADVNGDGYSDVYAGATGVDVGSTSSVGALYVFYGPLSGSMSVTAADATFTGTTSTGYVGRNSETIDANGDGEDDILIGAYYIGKVYGLFGGGL